MSRYNAIISNDVVNGQGVCVSFFVQGCPHCCKGCFNPETWDFDGGQPYTDELKWEIIKLISANGIQRNFSVLGGEPLAPQNLNMISNLINSVRQAYPHIKIFLWTGYYKEELDLSDERIHLILDKIDVLIDGPFIEAQKDLSLKLRGSTNQHIWIKENDRWIQDE